MNSQVTTNLNLRTDKFNVFTTLGYSFRRPPGNALFDNTYKTGDFDRIIEDRDIEREGKSFNANVGLEYFLTEKSSLTASFFTRLAKDEDLTLNDSRRFAGTTLDSRTLRTELEKEDDNTAQVALNYINNINDEGHKLTADFQYSQSKEDVFTVIEENNTFPTTELLALENIIQEEVQDELLLQADYVLPLGDAQFEAGYRGTFEKNVTDFRLDTLNQDSGNFEINRNLTNAFTYQENVNAVYTQYGDKFGDFSVLLGLRLENTQQIGDVDSEFDEEALQEILGADVDLNFNKNFLGLFPTINFIYELNEEENITLGYNRRINRPRGFFINPFPSRSSRTNIFQGNPDLNPAFANAYDLGYLKRWGKLTLTTSVYYQRETNSFERIQEETGEFTSDGIQIIRSIPINLSTNQRYGGEVGVLYNPTKWLQLNTSFNIFKFEKDGIFNEVDYGASNTSWFSRFSSKVSLPARIEWQTNAFYRGPSENAQTRDKSIFGLDLAFSKDIIGDKATISFNISDVLNSRKRRSFTETEFFTSDNEFQWRERQFNVSFLYRFNQPKERNRQGRNQQNGDEEGEGQFSG
jgi:hypothetical protein